MTRSVIMYSVAIALALSAGACSKDKDKAGGSTGETKAAAGPKKMAAPEFYKHYQTLDGMKVLEEYKDGVTVSGTVLRTIEEETGSVVVWLDAADGNWVSLSFTDSGKAAKDKGVKQGDTVTAKCQVGGASGKYIMNTDCVME
jgi:hypothetical protein